MLTLQQNCRKGYEYTVAIFEGGLGLEASIVYIQIYFLKNCSLVYVRFNLYQPPETNN